MKKKERVLISQETCCGTNVTIINVSGTPSGAQGEKLPSKWRPHA
jgi:hypothetical protein